MTLLPLAVLADDLTGAMDSGLQFARRGLQTQVQLTPDASPDVPVAVYTSESRDLAPSQAAARVREIAPRLEGRHLLKKIDSTLRGNIGFELRALLDELALRAAVVAPAFPEGGRSLIAGQLLVHGQPLSMSAFRGDPRWPMTESHLPTYLMQQSGMEVGHLSLDTVMRGPASLADALAAQRARLIVVDAATSEHLAAIADAVCQLGSRWLPCGSAGLADACAALLDARAPVTPVFPARGNGAMLFVVGSRNPACLLQLDELCAAGVARLSLQGRGVYEPSREIARLSLAVQTALKDGHDVVLESASTELLPGIGERVSQSLASVVYEATSRHLLSGLFLTGGEIALAVCRTLGTRAVSILEEIEPGIPGGQLRGGAGDGLAVVTKAGGFGSHKAMVQAREWLHRVVNGEPTT